MIQAAPWKEASSVLDPQIDDKGVHTWPFDLSFPIDVTFFLIQGQIRVNRHDYFEVIFLNSGEMDFHVQDRHLRAVPGDLVVVGSTVFHRVASMHEWLSVVVLYFDPRLVHGGDETKEDYEYLMPFLMQGPAFPHVVPRETGIPEQVFGLMQQIHASLPAGTTFARLSIKAYLKLILVHLMKHYGSLPGTVEVFRRRRRAIERLNPLFEYIAGNYDQRIQIADAARICSMSLSHFMYFFKQVTGDSFMSYLNKYRVEKAAALLSATQMPIAEISDATGFCDQSYFSKMFRSICGVTPLNYRRLRGFGNPVAPRSHPFTPASVVDPFPQWEDERDVQKRTA